MNLAFLLILEDSSAADHRSRCARADCNENHHAQNRRATAGCNTTGETWFREATVTMHIGSLGTGAMGFSHVQLVRDEFARERVQVAAICDTHAREPRQSDRSRYSGRRAECVGSTRLM
jgi:hypothetical protein